MSTENQQKKKISMSVLEQLKAVTVIVADTGDFEGKIIKFHITFQSFAYFSFAGVLR
jgi:hypothetical protein